MGCLTLWNKRVLSSFLSHFIFVFIRWFSRSTGHAHIFLCAPWHWLTCWVPPVHSLLEWTPATLICMTPHLTWAAWTWTQTPSSSEHIPRKPSIADFFRQAVNLRNAVSFTESSLSSLPFRLVMVNIQVWNNYRAVSHTYTVQHFHQAQHCFICCIFFSRPHNCQVMSSKFRDLAFFLEPGWEWLLL